jgi:hypothetical protein
MSSHDPADENRSPEFETGPLEMRLLEPLADLLARSENPGEKWLWCIYCERFFQAKHLRVDFLGNRQGCAFCECAGFECAIFQWDTFKEDDDPVWPRSVDELRHGLRLPTYTGPDHAGDAR